MQASGQHKQDLQAYLHAWASMMITIWEEKMVMLDVNDTWELYNSFKSNVMIQSGGDQAKISFAFLEYGFYVNSGTGGDVPIGNPGDVYYQRTKKPWFDKGWYSSINALRRDVARIYGEAAAKGIVFTLNNTQV